MKLDIRAAGVRVDVCDLPREGLKGNSHFPMMDRNSDAVAARVLAWLDTIEPPVPATRSL